MKKKIVIITAVFIVAAASIVGFLAFEKYKDSKGNSIPSEVTNSETVCDEYGVIYDGSRRVLIEIPENSGITEFTVPDSVETIGYGAFKKCKSLKKITFGEKFKGNLNREDFDCYALEEIVIEGENEKYSTFNGVLFNKEQTEMLCYPPMKPDETFEVPSSVIKIRDFGGKKLKNAVIPDSVKVIFDYAFSNAESLETVSIGKGLEFFESGDILGIGTESENPFYNCNNLKFITVDEENECFKNDSFGALYSKNMKYLLSVPSDVSVNEFTVLDTVVELGFCFINCADLEVINVGSGVENIFIYSMLDGSNLYGFKDCIALREINVSSDNPYFESIDGILYFEGGESLVFYPPSKKGESFAVPNHVSSIGMRSFHNNRYLEKVFVHKNAEFEHYVYFACDENGLMFDLYCESGNHSKWEHKPQSDNEHTIHYNSKGLPK